MRTTTTTVISTLLFVFPMLLLLYGTLDYDLSRTLVNPHSSWAAFFDRFGETPAFIMLLSGITILFGARNKTTPLANITSHIIVLPCMAAISCIITFMPVKYMYANHATGQSEKIPAFIIMISLGLAFVIMVLAYILQHRSDNTQLKKLRKTGTIFVLLFASSIILVNVLKIIWGRPRMRAIENISEFKKWYEINGPVVDNQFKSFPSGHTASAFITIGFTLLADHLKKINKRLITICALAWGCTVGLSRIVLGAHFLSDVLTGAYISLLMFPLLLKIFGRND